MVPLEVRDRVLGEQGVEPLEDVARTPRARRQVQHLLVPRRRRAAGRPAASIQSGCARARSESGLTISGSTQRPNCMPEPGDVVDQRAQPVGPHRRPTRTSRRGPACRRGGRRTSRRRARTARRRPPPRRPRAPSAGPGRGRSRRPPRCSATTGRGERGCCGRDAQVQAWNRRGQLVEPAPVRRRRLPRAWCTTRRGPADLAGQQQLAAAEQRPGVVGLRSANVRWLPDQAVCTAPDLAGAVAEARPCPATSSVRGVVAGAAASGSRAAACRA